MPGNRTRFLLASMSVILLPSCWGVVGDESLQDGMRVIGASDGELLVLASESMAGTPAIAEFILVNPERLRYEDWDPRFTLFSLDTASGATEIVLRDVSPDSVANERWIVWSDYSAVEVKVFSRATGEMRSLYQGMEDARHRFAPVALRGDELLINRSLGDSEDAYYGAATDVYEYILIDLSIDSEVRFGGAWLWGGETIAERGVFYAGHGGGTSTISAELSGGLYFGDRATKNVVTVATGLRLSGNGPRLIDFGSDVVWAEFESGGFDQRIRAFDPESGEVRTLVERFSTEWVSPRSLLGAWDGQLVVLDERADPAGVVPWVQPASLSLMPLSGEVQTLRSFPLLGSLSSPVLSNIGWYFAKGEDVAAFWRVDDGIVSWWSDRLGRLEYVRLDDGAFGVLEPQE